MRATAAHYKGQSSDGIRPAWCSGVLCPPSPPLSLKQSSSRSSVPVAPTLAPSEELRCLEKEPGSPSWNRCYHHLPTGPGQTGD